MAGGIFRWHGCLPCLPARHDRLRQHDVIWGAGAGKLVIHRDLRAPKRLISALAALMVCALCLGLLVEFGLAPRIAGHLYWDNSAQVRLAQWQVLDQLDIWQLLFGTRRDDLLALLIPLRFGTGASVIENFWLLMFLDLGALGFPLFVGSLASLLAWCWRRSQLQGRLLLLAVIGVASTSNSLGRKSTILVCLVAAIASLPRRRASRIQQTAGAPSLQLAGAAA